MRFAIGGSIIAILLATSAIAQTEKPKIAQKVWNTVELLESPVTDITFENQPLDSVVDWLQNEFPGLTIHVRWAQLEALSIARNKEITLAVKGFKMSQVLWMLMNEASGSETQLAYRASGNLILVSTAEDLGKEMITKVYDVTDLIVRIRNFRDAPNIDIQQAGQGGGSGGGSTNIFGGSQGGGQNDDQQDQNQQNGQADPEMTLLIKVITDTVHTESWQVNGGKGTVTAFRRQLVVRNNIGVHQALGGAIEEGASSLRR